MSCAAVPDIKRLNRREEMRKIRVHRLLPIREVSRITGVPTFTLRFWEKELGEYLCPVRTKGGQRRYDEENIETILRIKALAKSRKLNIPAIRETLGVSQEGARKRDRARQTIEQDGDLVVFIDEIAEILKEKVIPDYERDGAQADTGTLP